MTDKPTGVFVRLPNDAADPQWAKAYAAVVGDEGTKKAALWDFIQIAKAIGTPVQGGELEVMGYMCPRDYPNPKISGKPFYDYFPIVRQSDALAKLAAKDAEIGRLQKIVGVFSEKISEYASEGWDVPAPECVDLLDEAGVIEWGTFDPEVHDRAMFDGCEEGDPIWTLKGPEA